MRLSLTIPGDIRAAEAARRAVACFESRLDEARFETFTLLVNELVTNALLHACMQGEPIGLDVSLDGEVLRATITDPGTGFDLPDRTPMLEDTSGRGLFMVERLAERWGMESNPHTSVWFEV